MTPLDRYTQFDFTSEGRMRPVYRRGEGPAVIVIHEFPGLHPLVIRFADHVADAGLTVFLPSLFGTPGKPASLPYLLEEVTKTLCVRREFDAWATGRSAPMVDWLRALARFAHAACGGRGVGAVGMCFAGGFALAMMTEPAVVAPVLSQPSTPLAVGSRRRHSIDSSPAEIACAKKRFEDENLTMIGLRFRRDWFVPDARFDLLKTTFGERFEAIELDPADAKPAEVPPHSVLTIHFDDRPGTPTKRAEERVIEFLSRAVNG